MKCRVEALIRYFERIYKEDKEKLLLNIFKSRPMHQT